MRRFCMVELSVDDDELAQWAKEDEVELDSLIKELQDDAEKSIKGGSKSLYKSQLDFVEWVTQCPKCESYSPKEEYGHNVGCRFYTCWNCEFKWSENYLTKAICAGSHTEI